tara:strand:- start:165 stop:674 length:510 start_codon:yes stop_codon:yes gene_type:complete
LNFNPANYFLKRYHSADLKPSELKRLLNLWFPFLVNRIRIVYVADNFSEMTVKLIHSFWNRNPNKSVWGGSIASALDPFFPILLKQIILRKGIPTDFYSKVVQVQFIKMVKSDIYFDFHISKDEVEIALESLNSKGKYSDWHSIEGIDTEGKVCVKGKVQVFLRKRKVE